jgi:integrase/recombinase XerD
MMYPPIPADASASRATSPQRISSGSRASSASGLKAGPYGKNSKVRVVPMSRRVRSLLELHFALHKELHVRPWRAQGLVKEVANHAAFNP